MHAVLVLLAAAGLASAQFPGAPQCAVDCLVPAIPSTGCAETDIPCLCAHEDDLITAVAPCVDANCTPDEVIQTLNVVAADCGH